MPARKHGKNKKKKKPATPASALLCNRFDVVKKMTAADRPERVLNPLTGKLILTRGKTFHDLALGCEDCGDDTKKTQSDYCAVFEDDPSVNPFTGKRLGRGSRVRDAILAGCRSCVARKLDRRAGRRARAPDFIKRHISRLRQGIRAKGAKSLRMKKLQGGITEYLTSSEVSALLGLYFFDEEGGVPDAVLPFEITLDAKDGGAAVVKRQAGNRDGTRYGVFHGSEHYVACAVTIDDGVYSIHYYDPMRKVLPSLKRKFEKLVATLNAEVVHITKRNLPKYLKSTALGWQDVAGSCGFHAARAVFHLYQGIDLTKKSIRNAFRPARQEIEDAYSWVASKYADGTLIV